MSSITQNPETFPSPEHPDAKCFRGFMEEIYGLISGPAGTRDWAAAKKLYHPKVRFVRLNDRRKSRIQRNECNSVSANVPIGIMTLAEYIENVSPIFFNYNFQEWETSHFSNQLGVSATIQSGYAARQWNDDEDRSWSGVNFLHLVKENGSWRVLNMVWDANFHS